MKLSTQVIATAAGLLVVSAGVLYPIHGSIASLERSVDELRAQTAPPNDVPREIAALQQRIEELRSEIEGRTVSLCPDTLEARNEFESELQDRVQAAGLRRITRDRKAGREIGGVPCFVVELVLEGNAEQLHDFLRGMEAMRWVTRVLELDIKSGDELRRITLKIAVLLEKES